MAQRVNAILAAKGDSGTANLSPEVIDTWAFIGDAVSYTHLTLPTILLV